MDRDVGRPHCVFCGKAIRKGECGCMLGRYARRAANLEAVLSRAHPVLEAAAAFAQADQEEPVTSHHPAYARLLGAVAAWEDILPQRPAEPANRGSEGDAGARRMKDWIRRVFKRAFEPLRRRRSHTRAAPHPGQVLRTYGHTGTIHGTMHLDVETDEHGKVVAVWFRCMRLPFRESRVDRARAMEMRRIYRVTTIPKLVAVQVLEEHDS